MFSNNAKRSNVVFDSTAEGKASSSAAAGAAQTKKATGGAAQTKKAAGAKLDSAEEYLDPAVLKEQEQCTERRYRTNPDSGWTFCKYDETMDYMGRIHLSRGQLT
jgi:hypothetical protein